MTSDLGIPVERRPAPERGRDTKERLLDAAEALFAERGFEGTSMRAITQAAGASVSAANYHFGSKEALLRATLLRRVGPINRRRFELLEAIERESAGEAPSVERVLDAFLRPVFEQVAASPDAPARYRQVVSRLYSDPPDIVAALKPEIFGPVSERVLDLLGLALPDRQRDELALALQLTVGLMVHVISGQLETAPGLRRDAEWFSDEGLQRRMVAYAAEGIRAASRAGAGRAVNREVAADEAPQRREGEST